MIDTRITRDPRIDPRIKAMFGALVSPTAPSAPSREAIVAASNAPAALAAMQAMTAPFEAMDTDEVAPRAGLTMTMESIVSQPDGNRINLQIIRPDNAKNAPCVYYIHGGGMASLSCTLGNYRAWGRLIAAHGVVVVMVDFRNAVTPSSVPEIAPFPAGLNDCVSGLKWVHANAARLGVDTRRVIVSGESGGGNLTLATGLKLLKDGDIGLIKGLYAFCPYIAGEWPRDDLPSATDNNGIFINVHGGNGPMGYGIEAFHARDPLAWPGFATKTDLAGLPPVVINVNECDPLRDEGILFYRACLEAGVSARCREIKGTIHATELFPACCPEISRDAARDVAAFAAG
jgi:acetyl esterase